MFPAGSREGPDCRSGNAARTDTDRGPAASARELLIGLVPADRRSSSNTANDSFGAGITVALTPSSFLKSAPAEITERRIAAVSSLI
jgi:hypothetical protein